MLYGKTDNALKQKNALDEKLKILKSNLRNLKGHRKKKKRTVDKFEKDIPRQTRICPGCKANYTDKSESAIAFCGHVEKCYGAWLTFQKLKTIHENISFWDSSDSVESSIRSKEADKSIEDFR